MNAVRKSGNVGFFIQFGYADNKNKRFIDFGGWENQDSAICEDINGRNSCLDQSRFSVETGRTYAIEVRVENGHITHLIDGEVMNETDGTEVVIEPVYCSSSIDSDSGDVIVKTVNLLDEGYRAVIGIEDKTPKSAEVYAMYGWADDARNSFDEPMLVSPKTETVQLSGNTVEYDIPPRSVCVFRIKL
jgi:alpha-L-arabinofuranosidase